MRRSLALFARNSVAVNPNLIQIRDATFYREHPSSPGNDSTATNPPLFGNLSFELPATLLKDVGNPSRTDEHWAVIAANDGGTFLEVLRGSHICIPPKARSFPYLASKEIDKKDHRLRTPSRAIQYVGFNTKQSRDGGIRGAYLSARYESHREETDWSVMQYLTGQTELNPSQRTEQDRVDNQLLNQVIKDLRLQKLVNMPVSNLSNGQTRRSRIAKALLGKPELLLLDEPFMGLDPPTLVSLSPLLRDLAYRASPLLLLALRPQDPIPDWITHLVIVGQRHTVALMGRKADVLFQLHRWAEVYIKQSRSEISPKLLEQMARELTEAHGPPLMNVGDTLSSHGINKYSPYKEVARNKVYLYFDKEGRVNPAKLSTEYRSKWEEVNSKKSASYTTAELLVLTSSLPKDFSSDPVGAADLEAQPEPTNEILAEENQSQRELGEPLIELNSVVVKYGDKIVLGFPPPQPGYAEPGLNMTIRQGTRLALLGPNGSGKTTFLSLLTSDHPQSYSLPIKFFGRARLPSPGQPGLSLWEIQSRIGHSAPEVHAFFPKLLSIRQVLESAWSETYSSKPKLSHERDELVDRVLRWWEPELRQNLPSSSERAKMLGMNYNVSQTCAIRDMIEQSYPPLISAACSWGDNEIEIIQPGVSSDLSWAEDTDLHRFAVLPFGTQRLLLLLRALIKKPDIIILDEAFSGLSSEVREKALCWLEHGETMFLQGPLVDGSNKSLKPAERWERQAIYNFREIVFDIAEEMDLSLTDLARARIRSGRHAEARQLSHKQLLALSEKHSKEALKVSMRTKPVQGITDDQAMVVVSHVKEEIPSIVDEWIRLPSEEEVAESGRGVEMGRCDGGSIRTTEGWNKVWGFRSGTA